MAALHRNSPVGRSPISLERRHPQVPSGSARQGVEHVVVRRILMVLVLMIGVAATAVLVTDQRGNRQTRISLEGRDAPGGSDEIPDYLV